MNKIESYNQILSYINNVKNTKKGYLTNFYPDISQVNKWIDSGEVYSKNNNNTLLLFRKRESFFNLYYCSISIIELEKAIKNLKNILDKNLFVIDILGRQSDVINLSNFFKKNNFYEYVSLCRMSKSTDKISIDEINLNYKTAKYQHSDTIFELLNTFFDPIAEQLPDLEEINNWIKLGHIKIFEQNDLILGFIIYDLKGLTSYLRYWFVHPKYRDKKIGSTLLKKYFIESKGTKRQLFWVIQSNNNAIKRYIHYGFKPENMLDIVFTNKNIRYETKNN